MRQSLQRESPLGNPLVDTLLDRDPASAFKLTPEELRKWDLENRRVGRGRIVLRTLSFTCSVAVLILALRVVISPGYYYSVQAFTSPPLAVAPTIAICDAAEFITLCVFRGSGISLRIHVWTDGVFVFATATSIAFMVMGVMGLLGDAPFIIGIATTSLLFLVMLIHSVLLLLYFRTRRGREKYNTTPRVMYLPTGQAVVVTSQPLAIHRANSPQDTELAQLPKAQPGARPLYVEEAAPSSQNHPTSPSSPSPGHNNYAISEPFRQGVPPRKPVAGALAGTHYAMPWPGPEYQPDEAERIRAARGEKQAQWMTLHGMKGGIQEGRSQAADPFKTRLEEFNSMLKDSGAKPTRRLSL
ncbi:hypothetical protein QBC47DRAFT_173955 [Echria macrotheca]|uniref:Transmembrane protein n=1 Tax=Echria macrotheca TaxID=438768 RepID=A0AAJ0F6K7_9PEZI|nr:hypothetical protein QBC47DRAFT_173955 [Echria macrotheca]